MSKKSLIWKKVKSEIFQVKEYSDDSMFTLAIFLEDGLDVQTYIDFLNNEQKEKLYGNISVLRKKNKIVTASINEDVFSNIIPFTTTIENMIRILQEYEKLYFLRVDRIEIILEDDILTIKGD